MDAQFDLAEARRLHRCITRKRYIYSDVADFHRHMDALKRELEKMHAEVDRVMVEESQLFAEVNKEVS